MRKDPDPMRTTRLRLSIQALAAAALVSLAMRAHADSRLLPFQGRLTDANGNALPDGARVVQFKIYDAPVGGRAVWNGEVQNLSINGGLVSTVLGSKASLARVDFNLDLYLEVTIDANADGQISLADPPLLPRQSILPAVFARESADSQLLDGYDWSALFGTNNPADGILLDSKIGDSSLTTAKLGDGAITSAKIAEGAVTGPKIDSTGATSGQSLMYDGNAVVWGQVNALNADTAANADNAAHLNGFDWTALFNNGNPASGNMSVANLTSRASLNASGDLFVGGRTFLNGTATTIQGLLVAPSIGINTSMNDWGLYLRGIGDFNHFLKYGNARGNQSGFDGPILEGLGGGVLGAGGNWTLRWNNNGSVQVRGSLSQGSDRNLKEHFTAVNPEDVLSKVTALPVTRWNYKDDPDAEHIGPVAQDFRAAFGLGSDERFIATVDADGVAFAAIQGLNSKVDARDQELRELVKQQQQQIELLRAELAALRAGKQ